MHQMQYELAIVLQSVHRCAVMYVHFEVWFIPSHADLKIHFDQIMKHVVTNDI